MKATDGDGLSHFSLVLSKKKQFLLLIPLYKSKTHEISLMF